MSNIEWTQKTWNPIVGCSIKSPGCTNCYAMKMAARLSAMGQPRYASLTKPSKAGAVWTGVMREAPEATLLSPLKRKAPTTYFVNSMSDLFHEDVPGEWIDKVFSVMALTPQHIYQVLTKRSARMRKYIADCGATLGRQHEIRAAIVGIAGGRDMPGVTEAWLRVSGGPNEWKPLPNVWLGVSTERQQEYDECAPDLRDTPAAVRFFSMEPLLGPIVAPWLGEWVIVGGESGAGARSMHPDWARSLRDQCQTAGVPFFFKQWGECLPVGQSLPGYGKVHGATAVKPGRMKLHYGGTSQQAPKRAFAECGVKFASTADGRLTFRVGKKAAGRLLDGVEHKQLPPLLACG